MMFIGFVLNCWMVCVLSYMKGKYARTMGAESLYNDVIKMLDNIHVLCINFNGQDHLKKLLQQF